MSVPTAALVARPIPDALFRQLFAVSKDAIAIIDLNGCYLEQNESHRLLIGFTDDELQGRTPAIHLGEDVFRTVTEALRRTGWFRGEVTSCAKDGRVLHVELSAFALLGPGGEPIAYAGIKRDISERRRDQHELQLRYERLHIVYQLTTALAQSLPLGEIYNEALSALEAGVAVRRAAVLLYDDDRVMRFKAWRGLSEGYRAAVEGHSPWKPDDTAPAPILVSDVSLDPALAAFKDTVIGEGIHALGFIPLMNDGQLIGKFMIYFDKPHAFTPEEIRFCQNIGEHIALAISRKRRIDRISELNEALTRRVKDYELAVKQLERSQADLREKVADLENFEDVVIGRELRMMQLEKELEDLRRQSPP